MKFKVNHLYVSPPRHKNQILSPSQNNMQHDILTCKYIGNHTSCGDQIKFKDNQMFLTLCNVSLVLIVLFHLYLLKN